MKNAIPAPNPNNKKLIQLATVVRNTNAEVLKNLAGVYDDLLLRFAALNDGLTHQ